MIDMNTALTIISMATVTYLTRVLGYLALYKRTLNQRTVQVMEAAPGCVLTSVIAPHFVSNRPADLIALAATLLAATRLSMLPTVFVGVSVAFLMRQLLG